MENVKQIIMDVEGFERELANVDPSYYEKEYIGGAPETFIVFPVKGTDFKVFFPEYDSVKKIKDNICAGTETEDDLIEDLSSRDDLDDQFDFGNVVACKFYGKGIEWL